LEGEGEQRQDRIGHRSWASLLRRGFTCDESESDKEEEEEGSEEKGTWVGPVKQGSRGNCLVRRQDDCHGNLRRD
jgi:hypothetical protein